MQQLGFEQRHIHIRGTFRRAGFARKTIAQGRLHFHAAQRITIGRSAPFQGGANRVSTAARGHDLLARHQKRRTHRGCFFAAATAAVALFQVASE